MTQSSNLWDWAVAVHAAPGVDAALLELQDDHGQCVSFLLWAAWAAKSGRVLSPGDLDHAASLAHGWESEITAPLRAVRRALKRPRAAVADSARETLRASVKDDELNAERHLLNTLEALSPARSVASYAIAGQLHAASTAWTSFAPALALDRLAQMVDAVGF